MTRVKLAPPPTAGKMYGPAPDCLSVAEYRRAQRAVALAEEVRRHVPGRSQEPARKFAFELTGASPPLRRAGLLVAQRRGLDPIAVARVWAEIEGFARFATRKAA